MKKKMEHNEINKLMEIQYLKGRLDELYKGYVPHMSSTSNRIVDSRISKYEAKLKSIDEIAYYLYHVERQNVSESKRKSKIHISTLLSDIRQILTDEGLNKHQKMVDRITDQLNKY